MTLLWDKELRMRFGTVTEMRPASRKDKFFRKKYMGV
jgi:hypothetical protein